MQGCAPLANMHYKKVLLVYLIKWPEPINLTPSQILLYHIISPVTTYICLWSFFNNDFFAPILLRVSKMQHQRLLLIDWRLIQEAARLDNCMVYDEDNDNFGFKTLKKCYLLKFGENAVQTPHHMIAFC